MSMWMILAFRAYFAVLPVPLSLKRAPAVMMRSASFCAIEEA